MNGDERFCIEDDGFGEPTIWRIGAGYAGQDRAVLTRHDVRDADLWDVIVKAVTS